MINIPEELKAEYLKLKALYESMVGNLYPSIVYQQLIDIRDKYRAIVDLDKVDRNSDWVDLPLPFRGYINKGEDY